MILVLTAFQQFLLSHPGAFATPAPTPPKNSATQAARVNASAPAPAPKPAAQAAPMCFAGPIAFGGQINQVELCCDFSQVIHIGAPNPGSYIVSPLLGQCLFDEHAVQNGAWVLGTAISGGICLDPGNHCAPKFIPDLQGTVTMMGTSR